MEKKPGILLLIRLLKRKILIHPKYLLFILMNKTTLLFTFLEETTQTNPSINEKNKTKTKTRNTVTNNTTYKENTNIPKILTNILIKKIFTIRL